MRVRTYADYKYVRDGAGRSRSLMHKELVHAGAPRVSEEAEPWLEG